MLEIDGVGVRYGSSAVLEGLSWSVGTSGSVVTALLGPSGCGKSTLIRSVAGLEPLSAGSIRFNGVDLAGVPTHRRDFGVVFQDGQLFSGRSVAANIGYGLRVRRWSRTAIRERVAEMLELVRLPDLAGRSVDELSGGQAQRVALARALAPRPRLLLLDEPLAALDRLLRDQLAVEIAEIVRAAAIPTVVVTHDHTEAALMADTIAVMRDGALVQTAAPGRLWSHPADEWTARFLGVTTVVDADAVDGRVITPVGAAALDLPDGRVRLGLRPESVRARTEGPVSEDAVHHDAVHHDAVHHDAVHDDAVFGTVVSVADLPTGRRLRVATDAGDVDAVTSAPVVVGDRVHLELVPDRVAVIGA
ncbi:ABC transporter ATP-binding protein [Gordonia rhizosphera]|uniref:ABC-type quaternary amine transporter n=1 Tax=Gordonia rhizosphera NBRC 16068 TaxID=1108045 RepID=K6WBF2_9ACTN|nr:ABC transporter ATP-binding protein [Gordonia rhizosphera]GAB91096.1 putative ABC transporter ATP-binding protein [Gordonia rhizosphera NBRC 16068]